MKPLFIISLFLFISVSCTQATSNPISTRDFPPCEEVLSFVVKNLKELPNSGRSLSLAKKPEGYFLVVTNHKDRKAESLEYIQIWNRETGEYTVPKLAGVDSKASKEEEVSNHFASIWNTLHRYDFFLYYGYSDSDADIIESLESKKDKNLTEYEVLARAYSNQAGLYIHPEMLGIAPSFAKNFETTNYEKISKSRLDGCLTKIEKSMSCWKHIESVDPNYEPFIITNLHLKIANEYMSFWSQFTSVQEPSLAKKMLDKVNYSPSDLAVAKRMLDNCAENSFLFTSGDNDTFPLWYLQEKEGYRSDVTVMNTSLMQTDWYLSMCKETGNYKTSLTKKDYHNFISMVVVPRSEGETTIEAVLTDSLSKLNGIVPEQGYLLVPNKLIIQLGEESPVDLKQESYLYLWQLALLDILSSNPERTFYSASSFGVIWRKVGLDRHFAARGVLSELIDGPEVVRAMDEKSPDYIRNTLDKMDLKQINDSYLSGYELRVFISTLMRLKRENNASFEDLGRRLIDKLNIDDLAKNNNPLVIKEALTIYDELAPEKGVLLRDKYSGQARNLIDEIDDSGVNFMEKTYILSDLYTMYSGESIRAYYTVDSYNESVNDQLVIRKIADKVRRIKKNIDPDKMIKTFERLGPFVEKFGV